MRKYESKILSTISSEKNQENIKRKIVGALTIFLFFTIVAKAQEGNRILGGNFDISGFREGDGNAFSIKLQANYGKFVNNRLLFGTTVGLDVQKYYHTKVGIGPFSRLYWYNIYPAEKANIFLQLQILGNINKPVGYDAMCTVNAETALGHTLYISKQVALEGLLYYGKEIKPQMPNNYGYFGFRIGFQFFFLRKV